MTKTVIKRSEKLLKMAQSVFGHVVVDAWVTTYDCDGGWAGTSANRIQDDEDGIYSADSDVHYDTAGIYSADSDVHYDTAGIWLEFSNGRVVEFGASEGAWMGPADVDNSINIDKRERSE